MDIRAGDVPRDAGHDDVAPGGSWLATIIKGEAFLARDTPTSPSE